MVDPISIMGFSTVMYTRVLKAIAGANDIAITLRKPKYVSEVSQSEKSSYFGLPYTFSRFLPQKYMMGDAFPIEGGLFSNSGTTTNRI